jgi:hypothetical protein
MESLDMMESLIKREISVEEAVKEDSKIRLPKILYFIIDRTIDIYKY